MTGKQLRKLMEERGFNVADVASLTGYSEGNVRALLSRAELPAYTAKLMELVLVKPQAQQA